MDADRLSYTGFVSYSHADREFARALFARLSTYRLPRNSTPSDQRRLGRFFMDRESMPASGSLSDEIVSAITRSDNLIVVCSPNTASSKWVGLEIQTFRERRPYGRILCAVIAGDPSRLDGEASPYHPSLIRNGEAPLAADFRKSGDGFRLAFLKVAATLSGASLPALTRVDDARRSRRMIYATTVSGLVATSMTGLAVYAFSARAEANERKQAAENLVEFMTGDLRDRLADVGRLDVLEGVSEKVVEHYQAMPGQSLDCDELIRLGRAYDLATEVAINSGDPQKTISYSEAALRAAEGLTERCGEMPTAMFQAGHNKFWAGYAALTQDDQDATEKRFADYYDIMKRLAEKFPESAEYRMEFAAAGLTLGTAAYQAVEYSEAETLFSKACAAYGELHEELPAEDRHTRNLANCHGWHAQALVMQDKLDASKASREIEIGLNEQLVNGAKTPNWSDLYALASAHRSLARIYFLEANDAAARQHALVAKSYGDELTSHDQANGEWLFGQARTVALLHEIAARDGSQDIMSINRELVALADALPTGHRMSSDELIASLQLR